MALLEVKNIKKSFGKTEVLKGIDFDLEKGEVLSIIGSSGSRKLIQRSKVVFPVPALPVRKMLLLVCITYS